MRDTHTGARYAGTTCTAKLSQLARLTGSQDTLALQVAPEYLAPTQVSLIKSAPEAQNCG